MALAQDLLEARNFLTAHLTNQPISAIDPGYVNLGMSSIFVNSQGDLQFHSRLYCPIDLYNSSQTKPIARTPSLIPQLTAANIGGYFIRHHMLVLPTTRVLIETQPPYLKKKVAAVTRAFTFGLHAGLIANDILDVQSITVREYKNARLGISVHNNRLMNKEISLTVMEKLVETYPLYLRDSHTKIHDCADSFILLLSELTQLLLKCPTVIKLLGEHPNPTPLTLLDLLLLVIEVPAVPEPLLQVKWNSLIQNELGQSLHQVSPANSVKRIRVSRKGAKIINITPGAELVTPMQEESGKKHHTSTEQQDSLSSHLRSSGEQLLEAIRLWGTAEETVD